MSSEAESKTAAAAGYKNVAQGEAAAASKGGTYNPKTGGIDYTVKLTENLGIGDETGTVHRDSSGRVISAVSSSSPESVKKAAELAEKAYAARGTPAQNYIQTQKTQAQIAKAQKELNAKQVSLSAQKAKLQRALPSAEELARHGSQASQQEAADLRQQISGIESQLSQIGTERSRLSEMSAGVTKSAYKAEAAGTSQQAQYRENVLTTQIKKEVPYQKRNAEIEANVIAGQYNFQKPSAYQIQPDWLSPSNQAQREYTAKFLKENAPEIYQEHKSFFELPSSYATFGIEAPTENKDYFVGLSEGGGNKNYLVELGAGSERYTVTWPSGKKVENLTAEQAAAYQKIFAEKNRQAIADRAEYLRQRKEIQNTQKPQLAALKNTLKYYKAFGIKEITITSDQGTRTVPVANAYREIYLAAKNENNVTYSPILKNQPKEQIIGYKQDLAGKVTPVYGVPEERLMGGILPLSVDNEKLSGLGVTKQGTTLVTTNLKPEPVPSNPISDTLNAFNVGFEEASKRAASNPVGSMIAELGKEGLVFFTGGVKLATEALYPNRPRNIQFYLAPTLTGVGSSTLFGAAEEAIIQGNQTQATQTLQTAIRAAQTYIEKHGVGGIVGGGIAMVLPVGGGKFLPFKLERGMPLELLPEAAGKGATFAVKYTVKETGKPFLFEFETLEKARKFETLAQRSGKVERLTVTAYKTPFSSFIVGYGKASLPIISKVEGKLVRGSPIGKITGETFEAFSPTGRGLEMGTQSTYAQKIFYHPETQKILQEAGILTPTASRSSQILQEVTDILKKERGSFPYESKQPLGKTPLTSVPEGKTSEVLTEKIIPKSEPFKGSLAQKIQVEAEIITKAGRELIGDLDIDYNRVFGKLGYVGMSKVAKYLGERKALQHTARDILLLNKAAPENVEFFAKGTKVYSRVTNPITGEVKEKKVVERLTERDVEPLGSKASTQDTSKVLGMKYSYKNLKGKTPGGRTFKARNIIDQTLSKIASMTEIQGPRSEKYLGQAPNEFVNEQLGIPKTGRGFYTGPAEARYGKDILDPFGATLPQIVKNLMEKGRTKSANKLESLVNEYKQLHPEIKWESEAPLTDITREKPLPDTSKITSALGRSSPNLIQTPPELEYEKEDVFDKAGRKIILEPIWRAAKIGKGNFAVGAEVKFGKDVGEPAIMYTHPALPTKIFIGTGGKTLTPKETGDVFSHETIHNVLTKMNEFRASEQFDVIEYGKARAQTVKKIAPSLAETISKTNLNTMQIALLTTTRNPTWLQLKENKSNLGRSITKIEPKSALASVEEKSVFSSRLTANSALAKARSAIEKSKSSARSYTQAKSQLSQAASKLANSKVTAKSAVSKIKTPSKTSALTAASRGISMTSSKSTSGVSAVTSKAASKSNVFTTKYSLSPIKKLSVIVTPPPKEVFGALINLTNQQKQERKKVEKKPNDFIGNVPQETLEGLYGKRTEITTGIKRTARISRKDIAFTRKQKGFVKFVNVKKQNLLSKKSTPILDWSKQEKLSLTGAKNKKGLKKNWF